ncbi:hypothetical protein ACQKOE_14030 [Novosphingobium sp. NPDC080210]
MQKDLRVIRSNGQPANAIRRSGFVTGAMIRQHGSFAKALEALNGREA